FEDVLIEAVATADPVDLGARQGVQAPDRRIEVHWRVEQQGAGKVELLQVVVQLRDESSVECTEAEAGKTVLGDLQVLLAARVLGGNRHGGMQVAGIVFPEARQAAARGGSNEVMIG